MRAGQLPVDEQVAYFQATLGRNPVLVEVLARASVLDLPGWYLVAARWRRQWPEQPADTRRCAGGEAR